MFRRFFLSALLILLSALGAMAQSGSSGNLPQVKPPDKFHTDEQEVGLPQDMRVKMAIARAEGDHKKVLEDVEKLSGLSIEIAKGYGERKRLSADDIKKLSAIEKLAKRVLTNAGGEEVELKPDSLEHLPLAEAVDKLSAAAANIRK